MEENLFEALYMKACTKYGNKKVINFKKLFPTNLFTKLCDVFQLHLLVLSNDISYTFKFIDVMNCKVQD